jgi:hypothetical protein
VVDDAAADDADDVADAAPALKIASTSVWSRHAVGTHANNTMQSVLHCTALHCTALHCAALRCLTALHY